MAKMYYSLEETLDRLGCTEGQLKGMVRAGKLREFRDAGRLNYRVEEVDKLTAGGGGSHVAPQDSGELLLEDSGEIPLAPLDGEGPSGVSSGLADLGGSDAPIDLDGSGGGSGPLSLDTGSGEVRLEDSGGGTGSLSLGDSGGGTAGVGLADSGGAGVGLEDSGTGSRAGADIVSLDEVDKDAVEGMKKDDTVITNIGISVFDDDDLEIAADPMAKTLMTGADEHLGLDGSGGGSGLLDLTRESDDTSLGAELLEGIDMGDTAETVTEPTTAAEVATAAEAGTGTEDVLPEPDLGPAVGGVPVMVGTVEAASPAFTGLLIAGTLMLGLAGAANVATSMDTWPAYLGTLSEQFWLFLGGGMAAAGLFALVGWLIGRQSSAPRRPKPPKQKAGKKGKVGKPGKPAAAAEGEEPEMAAG